MIMIAPCMLWLLWSRCALLVRRVYILRTDWQLYADKAVARSEMTQKAKKKLGA
jgi:hypothetical protein